MLEKGVRHLVETATDALGEDVFGTGAVHPGQGLPHHVLDRDHVPIAYQGFDPGQRKPGTVSCSADQRAAATRAWRDARISSSIRTGSSPDPCAIANFLPIVSGDFPWDRVPRHVARTRRYRTFQRRPGTAGAAEIRTGSRQVLHQAVGRATVQRPLRVLDGNIPDRDRDRYRRTERRGRGLPRCPADAHPCLRRRSRGSAHRGPRLP